MVNVKKCKEDNIFCFSCFNNSSDVELYSISIVYKPNGYNFKDEIKLCKNCITDLQKLIGEIIG